MRSRILIIIALCITSVTTIAQDQSSVILRDNLIVLFESNTMIGTLGDDHSRIDIRFTKATKVNDTTYQIAGASRTRLKIICSFQGKISIDSVVRAAYPKSEVIDIDGFVYGKYHFAEQGDSQYSGAFGGVFKQAFRIEQQKVCVPINLIAENRLNLSEYIGVWNSQNNTSKACNWADAVIPNTASDFPVFNDAGEWIASQKYRKNGWDNMYSAYFNHHLSEDKIKAAQFIEEQAWWDLIK